MTDTSGFIDLYDNRPPEGNRPHFKGYIKINGVRYEFACWPNKNGKPGAFDGRVKPARDDGPPRQQPPHRPDPFDTAAPF